MLVYVRVALLAGLAVAAAAPAQAQFLFGDSWGQQQRPRAARQAPQSKAGLQKPRQQQQSFFSFDDDDDTPSAAPQRAPAAAPRGKSPPVVSGGPRPAIAASAPPVVSFSSGHSAGSVVIDTRGRSLYYVLGGGRAYRYQVAVGREGFSWTGTQRVSRVAAWPDWHPPAEMRQRDPRLPVLMTGGLNNPLGAKAIYLGSTLYRIHGTNNAASIGSAASSGCFRMTNANVMHLAGMVNVGTSVHVMRGLPGSARRNIASSPAAARS
jgi:lipoprotein-anchoring transpeptidase ErfK/SrfK